MWSEFTYQALPMRVVFGAGRSAHLAEEVTALGLERVLVLCTPGRRDLAERMADGLGRRAIGVFAGARMHVPAETAEAARAAAAELGADGCVAVGGGSTIGLGKAVALRHGLPVVAVPTTYAGSEMTPVWGLTENGVKRTGRDPAVLPRSVVYDPELTLTLPVATSVTSGMNALAHAVEGLYAPDASPIVSLMAEDGARALIEALPRVAADSADLTARSRALYGAWLCGAVLGATTMSLHHKLCHVLGGSLGLPHAEAHTVMLPHTLAYNQPFAPAAVAVLTRVLGERADPARTLWEFAHELGAPHSLSELGVREGDIGAVVEQALANPYANPREVTADGLTALLHRALAGQPPTA
ncbi:maleylacetate reductase [Streptomyces sp. NPDC048002]|uniref:maleylacetate reductase n=1 Tax=Streptomyces sp. NPDC048002 TaxID=3154344 RepID=UPI0033C7EED7